MATHGYSLLMTPLDLHRSCVELVRIYEHVRRNIAVIAPFLPEIAEIDIIVRGTPHNTEDIPLLGLYLPDDASSNGGVDDMLQHAIDAWCIAQNPDKLDESLADIDLRTWAHVVSVRTYPDRSATQNGG